MSEELNRHTESKRPKISVCITSYNHANYLGETLESVLAQTFQDFEIVVADDGSRDNSLEILESYAKKFPRIKVLTHPNHENKGISRTINLAIENAVGEYIAFLGSDDVCYDYRLEKQIEIFEQDSDIALVYGLADLIDEKGNKIEGRIGRDINKNESPLDEMIKANHMPGSTVSVRKSCLDKIGLFDETLVYSDWELNLRITSEFKVRFIDLPLAKYRIHRSNTSVGISAGKQLKYSNDVFYRLMEKSRRKEISIEPQILIKGLDYVGKRVYDENIENFIVSATKGELKLSASYLKSALGIYPKGVFNIKKSLIIVKYLLIGVYRNAFRRQNLT